MDCVPPDGDDDTASWRVAVLPDTQKYVETEEYVDYLEAQIQWIADHQDEIDFVTHTGDLVHHGEQIAEWERIDDTMAILDGANIPYSTLLGNHDLAVTSDKSSSTENYRTYFGSDRFDGCDWYGGPGLDEQSHYQVFKTEECDVLHLGLEWEPRDEVLMWASEIVETYNLPTLVTTHSYLTDSFGYEGRIKTTQHIGGDGSSAETVFQEFISQHDQILMVLCGHSFGNINPFDDGGEYPHVSKNDAGNPVYEFLANYQGLENGGNGWMPLITFESGGGSCSTTPDRINIETYSPALDKYQTDKDSRLSFDLDFAERLENYL